RLGPLAELRMTKNTLANLLDPLAPARVLHGTSTETGQSVVEIPHHLGVPRTLPLQRNQRLQERDSLADERSAREASDQQPGPRHLDPRHRLPRPGADRAHQVLRGPPSATDPRTDEP